MNIRNYLINIRNYLIKKLGGITKEEDLKFRKECEGFAKNHLIGRYGTTCFGNGSVNGMCFDYPLVIVGGSIEIYKSYISGLAIAPWVTGVEINGCNFNSPEVEMTR